jgi:hypothetical protein
MRWCALAIAMALGLAIAAGPTSAIGASSTTTTYEVEFDSTMVNTFLGLNGNDPQGTETTEIKATIPLTGSGSTFTGSAAATYAQATGTITESCQSGGQTGTTTETETGGNPTTLAATYTPGSSGSGGSLLMNLGPLSGGLSENFTDVEGCPSYTAGNTTPRFLADFVANHQAQLDALADPGDMVFNFTLTPGGGLGGTTSFAGTYDFTGGATNNNLNYSETTSIDVIADKTTTTTSSNGGTTPKTCTVPNVKGEKLAAAESKIKKAGCDVGKVTRKKSSTKNKGHVLSQNPAAGKKKPAGTKVALTVGK